MSGSYRTEQQIQKTLHRYCQAIDDADFDAFAEIFQYGHWFMVEEPGSAPVRAWLKQNVVLYDGRTLTRHEITNLTIESGEGSDTARFRCYVAVWQDLPQEKPRLLVHASFNGSFRVVDGQWWWQDHVMTPSYTGDLSGHIKGTTA